MLKQYIYIYNIHSTFHFQLKFLLLFIPVSAVGFSGNKILDFLIVANHPH